MKVILISLNLITLSLLLFSLSTRGGDRGRGATVVPGSVRERFHLSGIEHSVLTGF